MTVVPVHEGCWCFTALCVNEGEQMPAVKCVLLFELFISLALVKGPGVWSQWSDHIIRDTCSFFFLVCSFFQF